MDVKTIIVIAITLQVLRGRKHVMSRVLFLIYNFDLENFMITNNKSINKDYVTK